MSNGGIERRKEALVRGRQNDNAAAGPKVRRRLIQFFTVVLDVLQDVNVDDRVESWPASDAVFRIRFRMRAGFRFPRKS